MTRRPVSEEPLISMAEVAARLGVPLKTFRRWRAHHIGPTGYRLGKHVQFRWSEVEAWLQAQRETDTHLTSVPSGSARGRIRPGRTTSTRSA